MRARLLAVPAVALVVWGAAVAIPRPALADIGDISVGGVWVCRIMQPALGLTVEERVVQMNKQITEALSTPKFRRGATIAIRADGPNARIVMEHLVIVTVTPADTQGTTVTTMELARQWARRLATGLSRALPDAEFHTF